MGLANSGTISERHEAACNDSTKRTAGQIAAAMRKAGMPVKANEITPHAREWHHAGWNPKGGMGKCYFFRADTDLAALYEKVLADRAAADTRAAAYAWKVDFRKNGKRFIPVFSCREVPAGAKIKAKENELSAAEFDAVKRFDGEDMEPFESFEDFVARMQS